MRAPIRPTQKLINRSRRGIVVVELLLWLPVLLTGLLAVIEFAIMQQVNQQVTLASRYGAKIASEIGLKYSILSLSELPKKVSDLISALGNIKDIRKVE